MTTPGGGALTSVFVNVVPSIAGMMDAFKSAGSQGAQAVAGGFKEAWSSAQASLGLENMGMDDFKLAGMYAADAFGGAFKGPVGDAVKGALTSAFQITTEAAEAGAKAADAFMDAMQNVMSEKASATDLMGMATAQFTNFEKVGTDAIENTAGKIPVIGSAIDAMVDTAEGGFNTLFGLSEKWISMLMDVGSEWQETERTLAAHTLDTGQLEQYMGIIKDIASSGAIVHFKDIADNIALVNQRLPELQQKLGTEGLKNFVVTLAQGNEILGDIEINTRQATAAMEAFHVAPDRMTESLTEMINTSRLTGIDINTLTSNLDRLGSAFTDVGFSMDDAMWLLGQANKEGINTNQMVFAMGSAINQLSKQVEQGIFPDLPTAFKYNIDQAKKDLQNENPAFQAVGEQLLKSMFGQRVTPQFINAIKDGLWDIQEVSDATGPHLELVTKPLQDMQTPIGQMVEDTATLNQRLEVIGNQLKAAFEPASLAFVKQLEGSSGQISAWISQHSDEAITMITRISHDALAFMAEVFRFTGTALQDLGPILQGLKTITADFGLSVMAALKPIEWLVELYGKITHQSWTKDFVKDWNDTWGLLSQMKVANISDPMNKMGVDLSKIGNVDLPKVNAQLTQAGENAAALAKVHEAFQQQLPKPGGKPGETEPGEAFDIKDGQLKLIGDMKKTHDLLAAQGVEIGYDTTSGIINSIKTNSPQAQAAMQQFLDEAFKAVPKGPDNKTPEVPLNIKPTLDAAAAQPTIPQLVTPAPPATVDENGVHIPIIPEIHPLAPMPGMPAGPGPVPAVPPPSSEKPPLTHLIEPPTPGSRTPSTKVKDWFKSILPSSFKMDDDGTTHAPTTLDTDATKGRKVMLVSDVMDAAGVPSDMQGSQGVEIPASFRMHGGHGMSGHGGVGGRPGGSSPGVEAWRPSVQAVLLQSGGYVPLPNQDKWVGGGFRRTPLGVSHPEWDEQITMPYGKPQTLKYGGQAGIPEAAYPAWENAIMRQIASESGGNPTIPASDPNDPNVKAGVPSVGLLQYTPGTYKQYDPTGLPYPDPIGQIAATLFYAKHTPEGWPATSGSPVIGQGHGFQKGGLVDWLGGQASGIYRDTRRWVTARAKEAVFGVPISLGMSSLEQALPYVAEAAAAPIMLAVGLGREAWQGRKTNPLLSPLVYGGKMPKGFYKHPGPGKELCVGGPAGFQRGGVALSPWMPEPGEPGEGGGGGGEEVDMAELEAMQGMRWSTLKQQWEGVRIPSGTPPKGADLSEIMGLKPHTTPGTPGSFADPEGSGQFDPMRWLVGQYGWNIEGTPGTRGVMGPGSAIHNAFGGAVGFANGGPAPGDPGFIGPLTAAERARQLMSQGLSPIAPPDTPATTFPGAATEHGPSGSWVQSNILDTISTISGVVSGAEHTAPRIPWFPRAAGVAGKVASVTAPWLDPFVIPYDVALAANWAGNVAAGTHYSPMERLKQLWFNTKEGWRTKWGMTGTPQEWRPGYTGTTPQNIHIPFTNTSMADVLTSLLTGRGMPGTHGSSKPSWLPFQRGGWATADIPGIDQPTPPWTSDTAVPPGTGQGPSSDWLPQFTAPGVGVPGGPGPGLSPSGTDGALPDWWYNIIQHGGPGGGHIKAPGWWVGSTWGWVPPDAGKPTPKGGGGMSMCGGGHMFTKGGSADDCPWCQMDKAALKKADGGEIPWLERSHIGKDSIFAMLEPGEFIVKRSVAQQNLPQLHALNAGMKMGGLGFAGGGAVSPESPYTGDSGVLQVIYSDIGSGEKVGEAAGEYVGPGTAQPGYYGSDWAGHTGHVHTSFATSPGGEFYGMPKGTDIRQGAAGFPDWVYELGDQYGVDASTYAGHQESSGYNRGIDWWPHGKADMSGQSYSNEDRITLTTFAESMAQAGAGGGGGTGAPAAWGDMLGGGGGDYGDDYGDDDDYDDSDFGFSRGGRAYGYSIGYGGDTPSPGGPPSPDIHAGDAPVPVTVVGSDPNSLQDSGAYPKPDVTANQPGFVPATGPPPGLGVGPHAGGPGEPQYSPYGPLPPQNAMSQDQYDTWKASWDKRTLADLEQNDKSTDLQQQINDVNTRILKDRTDAQLADTARDNLKATGGDKAIGAQAIIDKATTADNKLQQDMLELRRLQRQQLGKSVADEDKKPYPEAPGGKKAKEHEVRGDPLAEKLGKGFIQGLFQELGFPDIFGKPFTEWGIWKTMMAGAGWGMGLLQNMGKSPTGMFGPGGPMAGKAWGGEAGSGGPGGLASLLLGAGEGAVSGLGGPQLPKIQAAGTPTDPLHVKSVTTPTNPLATHDEGGWLQPGQPGINLTGRPELVLTPAQSEHIAGGGAVQPFSGLSFAPPPGYRAHPDDRGQPGGAPKPPMDMPGQLGVANMLTGMFGGMLPNAKGIGQQHITNNNYDMRAGIFAGMKAGENAVRGMAYQSGGSMGSGPLSVL